MALIIGRPASEHTLHADAAAIRALPLVPRFAIGLVRGGIGPVAAAHVNFVFGQQAHFTGRQKV